MRSLHIALINHGVVHGCVYFRMAQQLLHLLYGHSLVDSMGGKRTAKLMRMNAVDTGASA